MANEMPDAERRVRLLKSIQAGSAPETAVEITHLIQAVGLEKAESLIQSSAEVHMLIQSPMSSVPKLQRSGLCSINRPDAIKAIKDILEGREPVPNNGPSPEYDDV